MSKPHPAYQRPQTALLTDRLNEPYPDGIAPEEILMQAVVHWVGT